MTTAAASIASSFPSSAHRLNHNSYLRSKHYPHDNLPLLKISPPRTAAVSSSRLYTIVQKWPSLKISAAVAQEETSATAIEQEEVVEQVNEIEGENGTEETEEAPVNTKLYFGNLPYNVDSAQLAGIIQDHASPELIEVLCL